MGQVGRCVYRHSTRLGIAVDRALESHLSHIGYSDQSRKRLFGTGWDAKIILSFEPPPCCTTSFSFIPYPRFSKQHKARSAISVRHLVLLFQRGIRNNTLGVDLCGYRLLESEILALCETHGPAPLVERQNNRNHRTYLFVANVISLHPYLSFSSSTYTPLS